jgi:catechol 2,3-dioxygenase-like lactoylglutathione lyase family enzyme
MRFIHANIATKDWKELADFYIKVFHCRIQTQVRKLSGSWLDRATGLPNERLEGVHFQLPGNDDDGPTLEIISYQDVQEDLTPCMLNRAGLNHITFEVDDVDRTFNAALKHGAQPLGPVSKVTVVGVCDLKFVYFRDPEGNIVEIQSRKEWKRQKSIWSSPQRMLPH